MSICMNPECRVKGRCDCCDARCPGFTWGESLLQAVESLPPDLSNKVKDLAHDITIQRIEEGY